MTSETGLEEEAAVEVAEAAEGEAAAVEVAEVADVEEEEEAAAVEAGTGVQASTSCLFSQLQELFTGQGPVLRLRADCSIL